MKLGIVYAMPIESAEILRRTEGRLIETVSGVSFYQLEENMIACMGGVGKVNAAMATQLLIDRYAPELVLNCGVAGSMVQELDPGDLVLATKFYQHDVDTSAVGDPVGLVSTVNRVDFPASYVEEARGILMRLGFSAYEGSVASGDWFVTDGERARRIRDTFHPTLTEMEGCAMAQVCYRADIPFLALKAVSDRVFREGENGEEYHFSLPDACAALTDAFLPLCREMKKLQAKCRKTE